MTPSFCANLVIRKALIPLVSIAIFGSGSAYSQTWNKTTGGPYSWNDNNNWSTPATFPNSTTAVANLNNDILGNLVINLNTAGIQVLTMNIGDADSTNTFTIAAGTSGSLIFAANGVLNKTGTQKDVISAGITFGNTSQVNIAAGGTLEFSGTIANFGTGFRKEGAGTLIISGTADNPSGTVFVNGGTLVLAKASTSGANAISGNASTTVLTIGDADADLEIVQLAGSYVGPLFGSLANYTDQIGRAAGNMIAFGDNSGVLDLNGFSEGIDILNSATGTIVNGADGTTSTLILNESHVYGGGGNALFGGVIRDGNAQGTGTGKMAVWVGGGDNVSTQSFTGNNTFTGEALISRNNATLSGAAGAFSGAYRVRVTDSAIFLLDNAVANSNRLHNDANIYIKEGTFTLKGNSAAAITENVGTLISQKGRNLVRIDHGNGTGQQITLELDAYSREQGGVLSILDTNNGMFNATTPGTGMARVSVDTIPTNSSRTSVDANAVFVGAGSTGVNTSILVGAFGSTNTGVSDFLTVSTDKFIRPLLAAEYNTSFTSAQATGNMLTGNALFGTSDDNISTSGGAIFNDSFAFNSWKQTGGTTIVSNGRTLYLGGAAADADYGSVLMDGSGMVLVTGTSIFNGGTIDFGNREAVFFTAGTATVRSVISGNDGLTKGGGGALQIMANNTALFGEINIVENDLQVFTDFGLGADGDANMTFLEGGGALRLYSGANIARKGGDETIMIGRASHLYSQDQNNTINGDIVFNNAMESGIAQSSTDSSIRVEENAILTINGNLTYSGKAIDPVTSTHFVGFWQGNRTTGAVGIININGQLSDNNYQAERANAVMKATYLLGGGNTVNNPTGRLLTENDFHVNIKDATRANGNFTIRNAWVRLGTNNGENGFKNNSELIAHNYGNSNSSLYATDALLLTNAGSTEHSSSMAFGNGHIAQSGTATRILGGENESGTVTFGLGNGLISYNPVSTTVSRASGAASTGNKITFAVGQAPIGLQVGMAVTGGTVQNGSVISSIVYNTDGVTEVFLNHTLTGTDPIGTAYTFPTTTTVNLSNTFTGSGGGSGVNSLTLNNVTNLLVGMSLTGANIPANTIITAISGTTVTLSNNMSGTASGTYTGVTAGIYINGGTASNGVPPTAVTSVAAGTPAGNTITLNTGTLLQGVTVGMGIQGPGIEAGTVITGISGVGTSNITLTLSRSVSTATSTATNYSIINSAQNVIEARLYAMSGGTVNVRYRFFDDSNYSSTNAIGSITKVGRGTTQLSGSTNGPGDVDGGVLLHGGTLMLDYTTINTKRLTTDVNNRSPLVMAGGDLYLKGNATGTLAEDLRGQFIVRASGGTIRVQSGGAANTTSLNLGWLPGTAGFEELPLRFSGGVINFWEDNALGGNANITLRIPTASAGVLPWATYADASGGGRDFAAIAADGLNIISAASLYNVESNVAAWNTASSGYMAESTSAGFTGTTAAGQTGVRTIDFGYAEDSSLNIHADGLVLESGTTNNFGGGVLVSTTVGMFNKTIAGGAITSAYATNYFNPTNQYTPGAATRDLMLFNYGGNGTSLEQGVFTIQSDIVDNLAGGSLTGQLNVVLAGNGVTHFVGNKSYTGKTYINGGTLWVNDTGLLGDGTGGADNPLSYVEDNIYINGGTLKLAADTDTNSSSSAVTVNVNSNRGIMLGGDGGTIEVTNAASVVTVAGTVKADANNPNFYNSGLIAQDNIGVGDLIKTGAGKLILSNSTVIGGATSNGWNSYYGLTEIVAGTLQINMGSVANSGILGSSHSYLDGTIVRNGATLEVVGTSGSSTREWITLDNGSRLVTGAGHADTTLDGVIRVRGSTTVDVATGTILRFNTNEGHLTVENDRNGNGWVDYDTDGDGIINSEDTSASGIRLKVTKTGAGSLILTESNTTYTGDWDIKQGSVIGKSQGLPFGMGALITLGDDAASASGTTGLYLQTRLTGSTFTSEYVVENNILVRDETSGNQIKHLGANNRDGNTGFNNDRYIYEGNIELQDDLVLAYLDAKNNTQLEANATTTASHGAGSYRTIAINGQLSDGTGGNGNLSTLVDLSGTGTATAVVTFELNNNNSSWTGDLTMGNVGATNTQQRHVVRLGHNQALTASNDVYFNYNNTLQVGGKNATIGNLMVTPGSISAGTGAGTNMIVVENASNEEGTLTVNQTVNETWDVLFRDGVTPDLKSHDSAQFRNNKLNLVKDGAATAIMTQLNTYTGTTTVQNGILQVGATSGYDSNAWTGAGAVTVAATGTLAGTGFIGNPAASMNPTAVSTLNVINGGLSPGTNGGLNVGKLSFVGSVQLGSTSVTTLSINAASPTSVYTGPTTDLNFYDGNYQTVLNNIVADSQYNLAPTDFTQNDYIAIDGSITVDSGARFIIGGGSAATFNGQLGQIFNLIDWNIAISAVGGKDNADFASGNYILELPTLTDATLRWETSLFHQTGVLLISAPEPGRALLLMIGIMTLGLRRRRNKAA